MDSESRDELISAALDGERVDVDALRAALATNEGRQSLAAYVLLRAAAAADDAAPRKRFDAHVAVVRPGRRWLSASGPLPAAVAASIAILAIVASFLVGTTLRTPNIVLSLLAPPPTASGVTPRVVFTAPAPETPVMRPASAPSPRRADQPPTPTRVLRFVPGVDWTSAAE